MVSRERLTLRRMGWDLRIFESELNCRVRAERKEYELFVIILPFLCLGGSTFGGSGAKSSCASVELDIVVGGVELVIADVVELVTVVVEEEELVGLLGCFPGESAFRGESGRETDGFITGTYVLLSSGSEACR